MRQLCQRRHNTGTHTYSLTTSASPGLSNICMADRQCRAPAGTFCAKDHSNFPCSSFFFFFFFFLNNNLSTDEKNILSATAADPLDRVTIIKASQVYVIEIFCWRVGGPKHVTKCHWEYS